MQGPEPHFLKFVASLEVIKARQEENTVEAQRRQVTSLLRYEVDFKRALVKHKLGMEVFRDFVYLIMRKKRNILMARPYFRERDSKFKLRVADVLRKDLYRRLPRFHLNFQFISWAMSQRNWTEEGAQGRKLVKLAKKCHDMRRTIIEANLPLAISQARAFYSHNRNGHMSFMDMVQVAAVGLALGVDKFVGPYTRNFRAVLYGRILGDLIEANSETFVHFFPADKRRLYRVRKIIASLREGAANADYDEVAAILNKKEVREGEVQTPPEELQRLMAAAAVVHAGSLAVSGEDSDDDSPNPIDKYSDDPSNRPDNLLEEADVRRAVANAINELSVFDQKLLRLKGVDFSRAIVGV